MFFFFSSRRRHTRFDCDWSSDVCSSDLSCVVPTSATFCERATWRTAAMSRSSRSPATASGTRSLSLTAGVPSRGEYLKVRSEEHTSELQSQSNLVCRLLLEKKKKENNVNITYHTIAK